MANRKNIIEILQIAEKYEPEGYCDAQHDELYFLSDSTEVSDEDKKQLEELGATLDQYGWTVFT
jgi:hypothetical protein